MRHYDPAIEGMKCICGFYEDEIMNRTWIDDDHAGRSVFGPLSDSNREVISKSSVV